MKNNRAESVAHALAMGAGLLASGLAFGCGGASSSSVDDPIAPPEATSEEASPLYVHSANAWPNPHIKVCWEAVPSPDDRELIRDVIRKTWELESNVTFDGWGICTATSTGLRIREYSGTLAYTALGSALNGVVNGVSLPNFQSGVCLTGWTRERCVQAAAVRGFGHALGFALEQNRSDRPASCTAAPWGANGDTFIGAFDTQSVMSGCNSVPFGDSKLSPTDIQGLQDSYGGPRSMSAVSWAPGRMDVFVRGGGSKLYDRWYDSAWAGSGFSDLGGSISSPPSVASWGANRLDIFARGTDGQLKHLAWNGSAWLPWESLGGTIIGTPKVIARPGNKLDVFVRGTDRTVQHIAWNGSAWTAWESLGGPVLGDIDAVSRTLSTMDIVTKTPDGLVQSRQFNGTSWTGWNIVGGPIFAGDGFEGVPEILPIDGTRMFIFARRKSRQYFSSLYNGTFWENWADMGTNTFTSSPTAVRRGAAAIEVFGRGHDGYIYIKSFNGTIWSPWGFFEYFTRGTPEVIAWNSQRLDLFVRGNDNSLRTANWNSPTGWSSFLNLGGAFR